MVLTPRAARQSHCKIHQFATVFVPFLQCICIHWSRHRSVLHAVGWSPSGMRQRRHVTLKQPFSTLSSPKTAAFSCDFADISSRFENEQEYLASLTFQHGSSQAANVADHYSLDRSGARFPVACWRIFIEFSLNFSDWSSPDCGPFSPEIPRNYDSPLKRDELCAE